MLEPRYIEQGGFRILELCEHNWLALPGMWAVNVLPEKVQTRKLWFFVLPLIRMNVESRTCQCAGILKSLLQTEFETMPSWDSWDSTIDLSKCSADCKAATSSTTGCLAYQLLQWWKKYWRGFITEREMLNRFFEFTDISTRLTRDRYVVSLATELLGNPFRPVELKSDWLEWNSGAVRAIAQKIYDDSDFGGMPILADALENAGCAHSDMLTHCRDAFHVRGCWVLDLLLAK